MFGNDRHSPRRFTTAGVGRGETVYATECSFIVLPEQAEPTQEMLEDGTFPTTSSGVPMATRRFASNAIA
jgi:hypothetical protein